ncbi:phosphate/phosphite/phosphonate ABC transporter substrate-binding protein [Roseovarius ramblicola]
MYDRPETAAANDRLWQGVRTRLGEGPERLTREGDLWDHWQSPDLLLSQTCGLPYRSRLYDKVNLVGPPVCDLPDCPPGHYYSVFVARRDDPRDDPREFAGAVLAYNDALSQSGWAAPQAWAAERGFAFTETLRTGAHAASARAVAEGRADIAALDALSWRFMARTDRFARDLRVVGRTDPTPALPWITAATRDPAPIRAALSAALAAMTREDRDTLGISGLARIAPEAYLALPIPAPPASELT